jgi:hypothetical protein
MVQHIQPLEVVEVVAEANQMQTELEHQEVLVEVLVQT